MKMTVEHLNLLKSHRDKLAAAKNFEEYQQAHLDYVDNLILRAENDMMMEKAWNEFISKYEEKINV